MRRAVGLLSSFVALAFIVAATAIAQDGSDADAASALALKLRSDGKYAEAVLPAQRALEIHEKTLPANDPRIGMSLGLLAELYQGQGRFADAEPLSSRALAILDKALPENHPNVLAAIRRQAQLQFAINRIPDAAHLTERELRIKAKELGKDHLEIATLHLGLGYIYQTGSQLAEAEDRYKSALAIREKQLPADHPDVANSLVYLAHIYFLQGRMPEAELFSKRSLAIFEKVRPPEHPDIALSLNNLGNIYSRQGRLNDAEEVHVRSLAIRRKAFDRNEPAIAHSMSNLAAIYSNQKRYVEAEALYRDALGIFERTRSSDRHGRTTILVNLAHIYMAQGNVAQAEVTLKQALEIRKEIFAPNHPSIAEALAILGHLALSRMDWPAALQYSREATHILIERGGGKSIGRTNSGHVEILRSYTFRLHALAAYGAGDADAAAADEGFQMAQWAGRTQASAALAKMAARQGERSEPLAGLVRELQDLETLIERADAKLSTAIGLANASEASAVRNQIAELEARGNAIDQQLATEYKEYTEISNPKPLSIDVAQSYLREDEALLVFLNAPETKDLPVGTLIWVVTKTTSRWVKSDIDAKDIAESVVALRCGLDYGGAWLETASRCRELTGVDYTAADNRAGKPLPFSVDRAHGLYKKLFGEVEDVIKGKHLLVVPSGALTQLPLQVLVTAAPNVSKPDYVAWLARSNPVTVLPAVPSLKALRQNAKPSRAGKPYLGVGNPLLDGANSSYAELKAAAVASKECGALASTQFAEARGVAGVTPFAQRRGTVDVLSLRQSPPLPETAGELCYVAKSVGASDADVLLASRASESAIKRLSEAGTLRDYRILHFATHGAMAGEIIGSVEPGLLLTPPEVATEVDDGYLSAPEIAALKLDADWVILSACNTAAGGAEGAEALSGLARAFFFAGARSLLVSHWYVNSEATLALIEGTFRELQAHPKIGRAEGVRRSMLTLIDDGHPPSSWAPFILVGEGAGVR